MAEPTRPPAQGDEESGGQVVTERAGRVAWRLAQGERLTNREIQRLTGLGQSGAWLLMGRLCRALPITFFEGKWQSTRVALDGFEAEAHPPMK